ncbi:MAG: MBL fold metallo-hydrolase [Actinobacteria bacterium]|uniref:Unannotated protein n=1 Tax=freshwater metagenome TaxID=449393 RepID=A0A6J7BLL4_9ZZZZ|nr:MBL fold metallo-hydrolase [Actinomycetota bacterium]MSW79243.1 MBL fold metallo-hydrolase [Actinomycetota bacterium]MSX53951.1 MBL fold metallo-hydrolase [Actinomycetota bacterium]MSX91826.1 MBL fold metallo-hydrolase [Actinomycetota bacterium]MSZ83193.1 MBL fold metallo-hydrolase [Actinomycetota bacterium]
MKLIALETGRFEADLMQLAGIPGQALLPVPAWLIEHPRGLVLFDTGLHTKLRTPEGQMKGSFETTVVDFPVGEELTARIAAAGYSVADIQTVIFSHLHFDHCGGTWEIPNAKIVVQESEWKAGHNPKLVEVGLYTPEDFDLGHDRLLIDGEHDLFGDGTIVCIPTPGHTRGHQSLLVRLASGPVVLTSDCIYFATMYEQMRVPPFGADLTAQLASMRHLRALEQQGCRLIFGHDAEQIRALPIGGLS